MNNIWDQLPGAPVFEFGSYLNPGHYDVQFDKVITKHTQKIGDAFIAEMNILTAQQRVEPEYAAIAPNVVGTQGTFFVSLTNQNTALPNIKQFVCGIFGIDVNSQEGAALNLRLPELMTRITSAENLLGSIRAHVNTAYKLIQSGPNRGKNFTRHDWSPYSRDLGDGYQAHGASELLARPVPVFAQVPQQAAWPAYAPVPQQAAWPAYAPVAHPGAPPTNGGPPPPPRPPPPPPAGNSGWQRANGWRLNPMTNVWEPDT